MVTPDSGIADKIARSKSKVAEGLSSTFAASMLILRLSSDESLSHFMEVSTSTVIPISAIIFETIRIK